MYGSYWVAVRKTFFSETVSMNMVMFGMIPAMVILMRVVPEGDNPWNPAFWGVMSMATLIGGITTYPINSWLVAKGYKHGMVSAPSADPRDGLMAAEAGHGMKGMASDGGHSHGDMAAHGGGGEHGGEMPGPSLATVVGVSLGTFALMLIAAAIASIFAPITF